MRLAVAQKSDQVYVVDTGYFIRNKNILNPDELYCTSSLVIKELKDKRSLEYLQNYSDFINVVEPDALSRRIVALASTLTHDNLRLSAVDSEICAVAVFLARQKDVRLRSPALCNELINSNLKKTYVISSSDGVIVLTGDLSVQNVCSLIGITSRNFNKKTSRFLYVWESYCK